METHTRVHNVDVHGTCRMHGDVFVDDDIVIGGISIVETLAELAELRDTLAELRDTVAELRARLG